MDGVVALLDASATAKVLALWAEFEARHKISAVGMRVPFPHVSFHVAEAYDLPALDAQLRAVCAGMAPVTVRTTGLGVFTGPAPVLYAAVNRDPALSALHAAVWAACEGAAQGSLPYYAPTVWVPHITLAQLDVTPAALGRLVEDLAGRDFAWTIRLDAATALIETAGQYLSPLRVPLGGA